MCAALKFVVAVRAFFFLRDGRDCLLQSPVVVSITAEVLKGHLHSHFTGRNGGRKPSHGRAELIDVFKT